MNHFANIICTDTSNSSPKFNSRAHFFRISDANCPILLNYDQVRIAGIRVKFYPDNCNVVNAGTVIQQTSSMPLICYRVDYDDATVIDETEAGFKTLQNQSGAKTRVFNKPISLFFKPRQKLYTLSSDAASSQAAVIPFSRRNPWLDTALGENVEFFGIKWMVMMPPFRVAPGGESHEFKYHYQWTYYLQAKNMVAQG